MSIRDTSGTDRSIGGIRDTSGQDRTVAAKTGAGRRKLPSKNVMLIGAASAVLLLLGAWVISGWSGGSRSVDGARVRIAEVKRGDLVRDIAADGRVIAANSPVLYAISAGTVDLKVVAGDVVKKGQELAIIDSPELRSKLAQEEATLAGLEAEASRANLDATLARAKSRKETDQASIERQAADRDLQRYQRGFDGGAVPQIDLAKAQDTLKKADISLVNATTDARLQSQGADLDARNKRLLADRQKAVVAEVRRQVDALTLRAPFDGQVGQVHQPCRQRAGAGRGRPVQVRSRDQGAGELRARSGDRHAGAADRRQWPAVPGRDQCGVAGSGQWRSQRTRPLCRSPA